jgi:hypothetical protein
MLKVIHTKWCFWASACTINQKLILVHPSCANDNALLEHEIEHTKQMMLIGTWTFWAKYIFSRSFRLSVEVDAYKVQINHGAPLISCASNLRAFYRLGISQEQAIELLAGDKT